MARAVKGACGGNAAAKMRLRLLFGPGEAIQHSRHNITQHVSKLKLELMLRWDGMQLRCDGMPCDAMQLSLETSDGRRPSVHTHTPTTHTGTNTSKHGAPVTAGDASVVGVHTGR